MFQIDKVDTDRLAEAVLRRMVRLDNVYEPIRIETRAHGLNVENLNRGPLTRANVLSEYAVRRISLLHHMRSISITTIEV